MKRLNIYNTNNRIIAYRDFNNDQELNEYISFIHVNNSWGKPEHQVLVSPEQTIQIEAVLDEEGNELEPARTEIIEAVYETVPSEFTYEIVDITSEIEAENKKKQIAELEAQITPRRLREALLSGDTSFIDSVEQQIQAIRNNL